MNPPRENPRPGRPFFGADRRKADGRPDALRAGLRGKPLAGAASFTRHGPIAGRT
jgi:hypothetical protein